MDFTLDFYIEMNEVLLCIAEAGVRLAGKKNTPEIIVPKLKEAVALQEKAVGTDKYYDYDYEFHRTFIDYSYNERLLALFKKYNVLHEVLVRYFYKEREAFAVRRDDLQEVLLDLQEAGPQVFREVRGRGAGDGSLRDRPDEVRQ